LGSLLHLKSNSLSSVDLFLSFPKGTLHLHL
jgi:hypothetical protein